jgi:hypothetical protein
MNSGFVSDSFQPAADHFLCGIITSLQDEAGYLPVGAAIKSCFASKARHIHARRKSRQK